MAEQEDPVFTHPEAYGIDNLEAPGEPDRSRHPGSLPIPGTGQEAAKEHRREHDAQGATPRGSDYRDKMAREDRDEAIEEERAGIEDAGV